MLEVKDALAHGSSYSLRLWQVSEDERGLGNCVALRGTTAEGVFLAVFATGLRGQLLRVARLRLASEGGGLERVPDSDVASLHLQAPIIGQLWTMRGPNRY